MAKKTLREFSAPSSENVHVGPTLNIGEHDYELKPSLINMVQAITFSEKKDEDASAHLQNFLETCSTINIKNIAQNIVLFHLFPFSLEGKAKQWFYQIKDQIETWEGCSKAFQEKYFLVGKSNALRGKISEFCQQKGEPILEAWERFQDYTIDCPLHGMEEWLLMQTFYHGLIPKSHEQLDATTERSFMSLAPRKARSLIDRIAENRSWIYNSQPCHKSEEVSEEERALSTKMHVLLNWLEQRANYKRD